MFEELPFIFGFMIFSIIVSYILLNYVGSPFDKIFKAFAVVGIIFHEICHLIMCFIMHTPVKKVSLIQKIKSEEPNSFPYSGEIQIDDSKMSFFLFYKQNKISTYNFCLNAINNHRIKIKIF